MVIGGKMSNAPPSLNYASSFRDLRVYQAALDLASAVYHASAEFPREEKYSLTDQIRRASRSIAANIAEAWGKRRYQAAFIAKLSDSLSETFETQSWLDHAMRHQYISQEIYQALDNHCGSIGGMLRAMENKADSFCGVPSS